MIFTIILLILGAIFLYKGADFLVTGSIDTARMIGVSKIILGIVLVSFAIIVPELFIGILSAIEGEGMIPVGALIGIIMFNLAFVMGLMALILPFSIEKRVVKRQLVILVMAIIVFFALSLDFKLSRTDGIILLILFILLNIYYYKKVNIKDFWNEVSSNWRLFFHKFEHVFLKERDGEKFFCMIFPASLSGS